MKVVVVSAVVIASCTSHHSLQQDAPVMPDACPTVTGGYLPILDCDPGGLAPIDLDGTWHLQGSATTWTLTNGSNMTSNTVAVDTSVTIQRLGCSTTLAIGGGSATSFATGVTTTALTYDCYHSDWACMLGEVTWSICVANGVLRYRRDERQQKLEREWGGTELDTLTR